MRLSYHISERSDPYENLALEKVLLDTVREDEVILYLWQSRHAVFIGKNAEYRKQCRTGQLERHGGVLVRDYAEGGAAFFDMGCISYTLLASGENRDTAKWTELARVALKKLGVEAETSGGDVTANGRVVAGSIRYDRDGRALQRGTVLVQLDMGMMQLYLDLPTRRVKNEAEPHVGTRIANLREFRQTVTVKDVKTALLVAFGETYGLRPAAVNPSRIDQSAVRTLANKFASDEWKYMT